MGILTGYMLRKHPNIYIGGPLVEGILTIIAIAIIPLIYIWNNSFWILNDSAPEISVTLYIAFAKVFWGLSFSWIWFACCTGRAGLEILLLFSIIKVGWRKIFFLYSILESFAFVEMSSAVRKTSLSHIFSSYADYSAQNVFSQTNLRYDKLLDCNLTKINTIIDFLLLKFFFSL